MKRCLCAPLRCNRFDSPGFLGRIVAVGHSAGIDSFLAFGLGILLPSPHSHHFPFPAGLILGVPLSLRLCLLACLLDFASLYNVFD